MRTAILLATAAVAGCASSTSSDPAPRERIQRLQEELEIRNESSVRADTLPVSPAVAMRAVVGVYQELEIPVTRVEEARRLLETENVRVARLAGERISRFLDCGRSVSGQRADTYDVSINLLTSVRAAGEERSIVRVAFDGFARPRSHAGNDVYCSSRGALEALILSEVRERAGVGFD